MLITLRLPYGLYNGYGTRLFGRDVVKLCGYLILVGIRRADFRRRTGGRKTQERSKCPSPWSLSCPRRSGTATTIINRQKLCYLKHTGGAKFRLSTRGHLYSGSGTFYRQCPVHFTRNVLYPAIGLFRIHSDRFECHYGLIIQYILHATRPSGLTLKQVKMQNAKGFPEKLRIFTVPVQINLI